MAEPEKYELKSGKVRWKITGVYLGVNPKTGNKPEQIYKGLKLNEKRTLHSKELKRKLRKVLTLRKKKIKQIILLKKFMKNGITNINTRLLIPHT